MIKVSRAYVGDEELQAVRSAFEYGYFGHAAKVVEFEEKLGRYIGGGIVVATNTGTSALHLALAGIGIGPGDEVIVPSLTFVASYQAIAATGATPVSCEVYEDTLLLDLADVRKKLTRKTKAIMPVHYGGNPCDMDALLDLATRGGIRIVEDAAHALGSTYKGRKIGSFGDITCFSFDSIKNITCGEGGAIIVRDPKLAESLQFMRLLGMDRRTHAATAPKERAILYKVRTQGFRYHMSNINAAIGLVQLQKLDDFISRRREICRLYNSALSGIPGIRLLKSDLSETAPHIYVVRVLNDRRDDLAAFLKGKEIETGINYIPNHLHSYFRYQDVHLPVTEGAFREIITLPLHFGLTDADVDTVINAVRAFCESKVEATG